MFRHRVRPPSPPLDEVTAERLLSGAPIEDLPDAFRPLGQLLADARGPASASELEGSAAAAAAFVAAHHAANTPRRRVRTMTASVLTALTLAVTTGTAVAVTRGALPDPMQQVAHEALRAVGISVPGIEDDHDTTNGDVGSGGSGGGGGGGVEPASATNGTRGTTSSPNSPSADPSASKTVEHGVPATAGDAPTSDPVSGSENAGGDGGQGTPQGGVAGENPNAGPGNNAGNGNPDPGEANNGNGNGGGGGTTVDPPSDNLPPQSNGQGNGPPAIPPGQTNK